MKNFVNIKNLIIFFKSIFYSTLEIIYPRHCILCNDALPSHSEWHYCCLTCWDTLHAISGSACTQCGQGFSGFVEGERTCPQCLELKPDFKKGKAAFTLNESMREWIHTLKYHRGLYLLKDLETFLIENRNACLDFFEDAILVPVPIHWHKHLDRGYNQSEAIAKSLRKIFPIRRIDSVLRKHRLTRPQVELSREERLKNVAHSFKIKSHKKPLDPTATYILIDDVFTTGSTLKACAKILSENGATDIRVWTIARG